MGLVALVVLLVVVGTLMYLFNAFVTLAQPYKSAVNVLVGLAVFLYILQSFGLIHTNLHL